MPHRKIATPEKFQGKIAPMMGCPAPSRRASLSPLPPLQTQPPFVYQSMHLESGIANEILFALIIAHALHS
mgnify:CR=1 FL=1